MLRRTKPGEIQQAAEVARGAGRASADDRSDARANGDSAAPREPFTYVHRGTVVVGEIIATGRVRVHGEVRGNVRVDGVLEIAESGSVEGTTVEAHVVKVLGRVTADVTASSKVEIWKGGVLTGDVSAPALDIEEGATFNGFSRMTTNGTVVERLTADAPHDEVALAATDVRAKAATGLGTAPVGRSGRSMTALEEGATAATTGAEEA